jgi:hypothetical protein
VSAGASQAAAAHCVAKTDNGTGSPVSRTASPSAVTKADHRSERLGDFKKYFYKTVRLIDHYVMPDIELVGSPALVGLACGERLIK